ncbi:MAG: preprotein translocase subunit SecE [Gammaproteobacteria bacterium]|nr:preprotein translocase subunit SecE [Gammaproteobacteria bacterium]
MNSRTIAQSNPGDIIKWSIVIILTVAGLVANYYFHEIAWPLRLAGWIILAIFVVFLALQTAQGKRFETFAKDARMELRKVEWPTRQETMQFTMGVVIMVMIMALALWLIDTALLWVVKWFTA